METLLESLAMLGKLGSGLDIIAQKLPGEIYALVEATIEEVAERAEYGRRGSFTTTSISSTSANISGITGVLIASTTSSNSIAKSSSSVAARLRLAGLESTTKVTDHETLRDLFWTLYSKLDAVAQGLRLVYEVANRIGSVSVFLGTSSCSVF